jgi:ubiquinone/menaquinone biosynthesis C-methylase UbiE
MLEKLRSQLPGVDALPGSAEQIPLGDGAVDAVFVAEAFHWFRVDEACREIARVLTRSGAVVLLWNRPRWSESDLPWLEEFRELVQPYRAGAGDFPAGGDDWQEPFDASRLFGPRSSSTFEHVQHLSGHVRGARRFMELDREFAGRHG